MLYNIKFCDIEYLTNKFGFLLCLFLETFYVDPAKNVNESGVKTKLFVLIKK